MIWMEKSRTSCEVRELKSSKGLKRIHAPGRTSCEVRELKCYPTLIRCNANDVVPLVRYVS